MRNAKTSPVIPFPVVRNSSYNAAAEREQNIIGRRLFEARSLTGWKLADVSNRLAAYGIETTKSSVSKWETGVAVPNAYQLVALCQVLGIDDSFTYFTASGHGDLNEEGMKKVRAYRADLVASGNYSPSPLSEENMIEYIDMPLSILPASAGTGTFLSEGSFETVSFPKTLVPDGADFALRISGDSMEPVYHDGQIVWIKKCDTLRPGEEGIFIYDGNGYIKVLGERQPCEDERELFENSDGTVNMQPVLISYNKAYPSIAVSPMNEFRIIGQIL